MKNIWVEHEVEFNSVNDFFEALHKFRLKNNFWIYRGVPREYQSKLIPSIDRDPYNQKTDRTTKIEFERQSIEVFRNTYKMLANADESILMRSDITSLMLMQHYGAPTRFLDWSLSPYIAAYFAVCIDDGEFGQEKHDGFIWGFEYDKYITEGSKQWEINPEMKKNNNLQTYEPAFQIDYKGEWFVCQFLYQFQFPRILAQDGLFTFYSQFNVDHAEIIQNLLNDQKYFRRYRIRAEHKMEIRKILKERFHIWHGMIYPDSTGIAVAIKEVLRDNL